ncbi:MAG: hypothetical protein AAFR54_14415 [Planctomycetota bacterium]
MNRSSLLLVALAAVVGGLGFFLLRTPTAPDTAEETAAEVEPDGPSVAATQPAEPTALADVDDTPVVPRAFGDGKVDRWRILPMNNLGQSWAQASIRAEQNGAVLEETGTATFEDVRSGTWDVSVEVEGQPRWERRVSLEPGRSTRTIAYVDETLRISGSVVDTEGEVVENDHVLFMPTGVVGPTSVEAAEIRASRAPQMTTGSGIVVTRTAKKNGRFLLTLPSAGAYRVAVGDPEKPRWIQRKATELTHGGPDKASILVPATVSVSMTFDGPPEECPTQVTAYFYDRDLADRLANEQVESGGGRGGSADVKSSQKKLRREALRESLKEAGRDVDDEMIERMLDDKLSAQPAGKQNRETFDRNMELYGGSDDPVAGAEMRAPLFEPGWRAARSTRFIEGEAILRNLPDDVGLRFLFVRERERITSSSPVRPRRAMRNLAEVRLPAPPQNTSTTRRSNDARVFLDRTSSNEDGPEPTVTWTVGRR